MPINLKLMFLCAKVKLVDTFSMIQFCINIGSQHRVIVVDSAAGNFYNIGRKVL